MTVTPEQIVEAILKALEIIEEIASFLDFLRNSVTYYKMARRFVKSAFTRSVSHDIKDEEMVEIKDKIRKLEVQMNELKSRITKFNEQVEETMRIQKIDFDRSFYFHLGRPIGFNIDFGYLCSILREVTLFQWLSLGATIAYSFKITTINVGVKTAAGFCSLNPSILIFVAALGAVLLLFSSFNFTNPTLKAIDDLLESIKTTESEMRAALTEFMNVIGSVKKTTMNIIISDLKQFFGGGYSISKLHSTITPWPFSKFVEEIGRGEEGGIYQLSFIAEMQGCTIEIIDRTSDQRLTKDYGKNVLKLEPFNKRTSQVLRIEITGEEGVFHYRPTTSEGKPIEIKSSSQYGNRCLYDSIAFQLGILTDTLIQKLQTFLKKNIVAEELYEENMQEIFPEFKAGAKKREKTPASRNRSNQVSIRRSLPDPSIAIVRATVRYENLNQGSSVSGRVRDRTLENGRHSTVGNQRTRIDHSGHIIAAMLGGPGDDINNVEPMLPLLNQRLYRKFEYFIRRTLFEHQDWRAEITVTIIYNPNSDLPRRPIIFIYTVKFYEDNWWYLFNKPIEIHEETFENGEDQNNSKGNKP